MSDEEGENSTAGQVEEGERQQDENVLNFSLSRNLIKVTDFIAAKGGNVTKDEIRQFRTFAAELAKRDVKTLKKPDRDWLSNYLQNYELLDELLLLASNAEGFAEAASKMPWASATPPLPPRPDSRAPQEQTYEVVEKTETGDKMKLNELVIKPVSFDGVRPPPRTWLDDYEKAAEANGWSNTLKAKYMNTFLKDTANDWIVTFARRKFGAQPSWNDLRKSFIQHYIGDTDKNQLRRTIATTFQKRDEKASVFIPRLLRLLLLMEPDKKEEDLVEEVKVKMLGYYQDKLALLDIHSTEGLVSACLKVEAGSAAAKTSLAREEKVKPFEKQHFRNKDRPSRWSRDNKVNDTKPKRIGVNDAKKPTQKAAVKCYRCQKLGHYARECDLSRNGNGGKPTNMGNHRDNVAIVQAPQKEAKPQGSASDQQTSHVSTINSVRAFGKLMTIGDTKDGLVKQTLICNGIEVCAVIDTGAVKSVISRELAEQQDWPVRKSTQVLSHAAGGQLKIMGEIEASISIGAGKGATQTVAKLVVIDNLCAPMIVGLDILSKLGATIDVAGSRLQWKSAKMARKKGVRAVGQVIPGRSITMVEASVDVNSGTIMCYGFNVDPAVMVASSICNVEEGTTTVQVANIDAAPIKLAPGQQLASFERMDLPQQSSLIGALLPISDTDEVVTVGGNLTERQVDDLRSLFCEYKDAFSINGSIGRTSVIEHKIDIVEGARPIVEPIRRHPKLHEIEAERQVDGMLKDDIIEESSSPWASEYVLVKKKTGDWRLCVDFRRLNSVTKKNSFPLPNAETCVEALSGKNYFSKLDFASGYWQVPMERGSRELTAFRTSKGLYQFKVMPFGLTNAPASFQKLINAMLAGLTGLHLQVYLDDVCVATDTWQQHIEMLTKIFKLVIRANMKLKGSKCEFGLNQITFLGHLVSSNGVQQDPEKLAALRNLPPPIDVSGVRRVVGAFSYYRKFVPSFATISAPLTRLTSKGVQFHWGQKEQNAFDELKMALAQNATLAWLDDKGEIRLKTDASLIGVGGILLQMKNGDWRIVTCASRKLNNNEKNYSATELEGLAVVYCVTKFRCYLIGRAFSIYTDHCALCALKTKASTNARLRRWALVLSEYDFRIEYVSGKRHEDADCLSRAPAGPDENYLDEKLLAIATPIAADSWLRNPDDETQRLYELALNSKAGFNMRNGLIYRHQKLYVPKSYRVELIRQSHDESYAGHDGVRGTLARMENLFWPDMTNDVQSYVSTCQLCQLRKVERSKPKGSMQSFNAMAPLEMIAVDYLGPLQPSQQYRHICVAVDAFSKYVVAEPMVDRSAAHFVKFLRDFIAKFGVPKLLISDNGRQFDDSTCRRLYADLQIQHRQLAAYHHRGNALAERAIETLQEKLNLFMNQKKQNEWHKVLSEAVLCMNTRKHSTTNHSPYTLMFNRIHADVQNAMQSQNKLLTADEAEATRSEANLASTASKERSRKYFEQKNEGRNFDLDQLVLSKLKDRRLSKLANRFEGPFKVVEKSNDIYGLINCQTGKKIYRHTSYLKPYQSVGNMFSLMHVALIITLATSIVAARVILQQTSPVYWTEVADKYVSEGSEYLPYELYFSSPCNLLLRYEQMLAKTNQITQTKRAASIVINGPVIQAPRQTTPTPLTFQIRPPMPPQMQSPIPVQIHSSIPARIPSQLPPQLPLQPTTTQSIQTDTNPFIEIDIDQEEEEIELNLPTTKDQGIWLNKKEMDEYKDKNQTRSKRGLTYFERCEEVYKSSLIGVVQRFQYDARPRQKRFIEFVAGVIFSNVIQAVKDNYFSNKPPSTFEDRFSHAQAQLKLLNDRTDLLVLSQKASLTTMKQTANVVNNLAHQITLQPTLNVIADYLISEIYQKKQLLERLYFSLEEGKGDMVTLAQLFNSAQFDKMLAQDVEITTAKSPSVGVLRVEIVGRIRSRSTKIFQVNALPHYRNLSVEPIRYDYVGKTLLIFNRTSDCVRGIETTTSNFVTTTCDEPKFRDEALRLWRKTAIHNITVEPRHSTYAMLWPRSIVYCWGNNITIELPQPSVTECPYYSFFIDSHLSFHTSDNLVRHKGGNITKQVVTSNLLDTFDTHFDDFKPVHIDFNDGLRNIERLTKENDELRKKQVLLTVNGQPINIHHAMTTTTVIVGLLILTIIILVLKQQKTTKRLWNRIQNRTSQRQSVADQVDARITSLIARASVSERRRSQAIYEPRVTTIKLNDLTRGVYS